MNRYSLGGLCAFGLLVALLTACGNDPEVTTNNTPAPVPTVAQGSDEPAADPGDAARAYMEAMVAIDDIDVMRDGLAHAAEGSTAHVYLQHQINMAEALLDGGNRYDPFELTPAGGGYELCDPYDATECRTFEDFTVDASGKLTGFTVDGESPEGRLTAGNGDTVESNGLTVEFMTAYEAITENVLVVTARVSSGSEELELGIYSATYRDPDGRQREATDAAGPDTLAADSNAMVELLFASAEPGGQVTLTAWTTDDYTDIEVTFDVG